MHKGRPKPIRLQGQKSEKNEPAFIVQNMNTGNGPSIKSGRVRIRHQHASSEEEKGGQNMPPLPKRSKSTHNAYVPLQNVARASSFGDRLYLDDNAKGKSLEDQYVGTSRFLKRS
eukprot:926890_1